MSDGTIISELLLMKTLREHLKDKMERATKAQSTEMSCISGSCRARDTN